MASSDICLLRAEGRDGKGKQKKKSQLYVFWLWGEETQQENCLKSSWQDHLESAFVGAASGLP